MDKSEKECLHHSQVFILRGCNLTINKINSCVENHEDKILVRVMKKASKQNPKIRIETNRSLVFVTSKKTKEVIEELKNGLSELCTGFSIGPYEFREKDFPEQGHKHDFWFTVPKTLKDEEMVASKTVNDYIAPLHRLGLTKFPYLIEIPAKSRDSKKDEMKGMVIVKYKRDPVTIEEKLICSTIRLFINNAKWEDSHPSNIHARWERIAGFRENRRRKSSEDSKKDERERRERSDEKRKRSDERREKSEEEDFEDRGTSRGNRKERRRSSSRDRKPLSTSWADEEVMEDEKEEKREEKKKIERPKISKRKKHVDIEVEDDMVM